MMMRRPFSYFYYTYFVATFAENKSNGNTQKQGILMQYTGRVIFHDGESACGDDDRRRIGL